MRYSEARQGRTFILRLEHGEILHESVETFAQEHHISAGSVIAIGGADAGSILVVGPEDGEASPVVPMEYVLPAVHEICGTGTLFPDSEGRPVLHMHIASGRNGKTVTGCVRRGVRTWQVMEIILHELVETTAKRVFEKTTGFELLSP